MSLHNSSSCRVLLLGVLGLLLSSCATDDVPSATATLPELLTHAERRFQDGDLNGATASFRRALQKDSTSTTATMGLARVYEAGGKADLAERYRNRAFHVNYLQGTQARESGDLKAARVAFGRASAAMPGHPMPPLQIAEVWAAEGHLDSAIAYFEMATKLNPRFTEARLKLSEAYLRAGRTDEAQIGFEAAIELNVNAVEAYLSLGQIYSERGEWAQAAAHYDRALLIRPSSEKARQGLQAARAHL